MTPLRVPVEIAAKDRRCWRLSDGIDMGMLSFGREIPFDSGTVVNVAFTLPGGARVEAAGEVRAPREVGFAVDPETREAVAAYLDE